MPMLTSSHQHAQAMAAAAASQRRREFLGVEEAEQRTSTSPENKRRLSMQTRETGEEEDPAIAEPASPIQSNNNSNASTLTPIIKRRKMTDDLTAEVAKYVHQKKETIDGGLAAAALTMQQIQHQSVGGKGGEMNQQQQRGVDATELASAFALASLMNASPMTESRETESKTSSEPTSTDQPHQNRMLNSNDDAMRKAASFDAEQRSPHTSNYTLSPEPRSASPQDLLKDANKDTEEDGAPAAAVTNDPSSSPSSSPGLQRKVSFATNTKAGVGPSTKASSTAIVDLTESSSRNTSLAMPQPPATPKQASMQQRHYQPQRPSPHRRMPGSPRPYHRMQHGVGRDFPPFFQTPSPRQQPPQYGGMTMLSPPPPPHAAHHHQYSQHYPHRRHPHPPQQHSFRHGAPPSPHAPPLSPGYGMLYGGGGLHTPPLPPRASPNRSGSLQHPPQLMQPPLVHRTNSMDSRSRASSSSSGAAGDTPPPPPTAVTENKWICDYCNIASFSNYEEACAHEVMCQRSFLNTGGPAGPSAGLLTMGSRSYSMGASMDQDDMSLSSYSPSMLSSPVPAYQGGGMLPLSSPMVSPLPVLGHHGSGGGGSGPYPPPPPSSPHGYAGHGPVAMAAARRHRLRQAHAAAEQQYQASRMSSRNRSMNSETMMGHPPPAAPPPSSHPYYAPQGRRFEERNRSGVSSLSSKVSASAAAATSKGSTKQDRPKPQLPPMTVEERHKQEAHLQSMAGYLVNPSDVDMIPPYVYSLMRQVEPCLFTEADRFVARSKGPVGYPGFQCRHCNGHAGLGKYFPVSSKSFSTNSTSQNIHAHMLKCRKCPEVVKEQLIQLKIEKSRAARLEPGWRKVFFDKVWHRLHYCEGNSTKSDSNTATCVGINQSNTGISTSTNENTEGQTDDSNAITDPVSTSTDNSNNNSNVKNQDTNTVQNNMTKV